MFTHMATADLITLTWGGQIPIMFVLAAADVAQLHPPAPRYVMGSRMAYLPRLAEEAIASFRLAVAPSGGGSQNVWFEASGVPLKWQLPMGVLVDAVRGYQPPSPLPFQVVVHFHDFPSDKVLACAGMESARRSYINNLKQSACLRFGSAKRVLTGLSEIQQQQMWEAIATGNHLQFSACNETLHGLKCEGKVERRSVRLVAAVDSVKKEGGDIRLRSVLRPLVEREEGEEEELDKDAGDGGGGGGGGDSGTTVVANVTLASFLKTSNVDESEGTITVHGVPMPLDADLVELHELMSSADNCLYVVLSGSFVQLL